MWHLPYFLLSKSYKEHQTRNLEIGLPDRKAGSHADRKVRSHVTINTLMVLVEQTLLTRWADMQFVCLARNDRSQRYQHIHYRTQRVRRHFHRAVVSTLTNTALMHRTTGSTWAPAGKASESAVSSAGVMNLAEVTSRTAHLQTEIRTWTWTRLGYRQRRLGRLHRRDSD